MNRIERQQARALARKAQSPKQSRYKRDQARSLLLNNLLSVETDKGGTTYYELPWGGVTHYSDEAVEAWAASGGRP